jgi:hypothetical protein
VCEWDWGNWEDSNWKEKWRLYKPLMLYAQHISLSHAHTHTLSLSRVHSHVFKSGHFLSSGFLNCPQLQLPASNRNSSRLNITVLWLQLKSKSKSCYVWPSVCLSIKPIWTYVETKQLVLTSQPIKSQSTKWAVSPHPQWWRGYLYGVSMLVGPQQ